MPTRMNLLRVLAALLLFSISFAFVESAVVLYLRAIYEPMHQRLYPDRGPTDLFPIIRPDQLEAAGPEHLRQLATELAREAATLVMLAAAGLAVAANSRQWVAAFAFAFGVWDICYYAFLKVLLDWPESLATRDLLFLLPLPWVGPVWSPVLVSIAMIIAGVLVLWREAIGVPVQFAWPQVTMILGGGSIVITAFCWDWRNIAVGGEPNAFHWPLFAAGLVIGASAFGHAIWKTSRPGGFADSRAMSRRPVTAFV